MEAGRGAASRNIKEKSSSGNQAMISDGVIAANANAAEGGDELE